jgi:hypothetical protein
MKKKPDLQLSPRWGSRNGPETFIKYEDGWEVTLL